MKKQATNWEEIVDRRLRSSKDKPFLEQGGKKHLNEMANDCCRHTEKKATGFVGVFSTISH